MKFSHFLCKIISYLILLSSKQVMTVCILLRTKRPRKLSGASLCLKSEVTPVGKYELQHHYSTCLNLLSKFIIIS